MATSVHSKGVIRYYVPKGSAGTLESEAQLISPVNHQRDRSIEKNMRDTKQKKGQKQGNHNNNKKKGNYQVYYEPKGQSGVFQEKTSVTSVPALNPAEISAPKLDRLPNTRLPSSRELSDVIASPEDYNSKKKTPKSSQHFNFSQGESFGDVQAPLKFAKSMSGEREHKSAGFRSQYHDNSDCNDEHAVFSQTTDSTNFSSELLKDPLADTQRRFITSPLPPAIRSQNRPMMMGDFSQKGAIHQGSRNNCQITAKAEIMSLDIFVRYQLENHLLKPFAILASHANYIDQDECWVYVDPNDDVQGPFSSVVMDTWFNDGYFENDLQVCFTEHDKFSPLAEFVDCASKLEYIKYFNLSRWQADTQRNTIDQLSNNKVVMQNTSFHHQQQSVYSGRPLEVQGPYC